MGVAACTRSTGDENIGSHGTVSDLGCLERTICRLSASVWLANDSRQGQAKVYRNTPVPAKQRGVGVLL